MEPNHKNDKPEDDMQHLAHRRADTALMIISIALAAAFIGFSAYVVIWHLILPMLGVQTCQ